MAYTSQPTIVVPRMVAHASDTRPTPTHPADGSGTTSSRWRLQHHCTRGSSFAGGSAVVGQGAELVSTGPRPALGTQAAARCRLCRLLPQAASTGRWLYSPVA